MQKLTLALGWMSVALFFGAQSAFAETVSSDMQVSMQDYDLAVIEEKAANEPDFYEMLVNIEVLKPQNSNSEITAVHR